jgi:hypothetical protein
MFDRSVRVDRACVDGAGTVGGAGVVGVTAVVAIGYSANPRKPLSNPLRVFATTTETKPAITKCIGFIFVFPLEPNFFNYDNNDKTWLNVLSLTGSNCRQ